jgi:energy-coupling factor transporter ATP-binding protein EcfA2
MSVHVARGEGLAVLGPAGAGKTTFLHAVAGLLHAQEHAELGGDIRLDEGEPLSRSTLTAFPTVAMLPQDPRHIVSGFVPTVEEEIGLTLRQAMVPPGDREAAKRSILGQLPISHLMSRHPATLSGGEMQTVALAIAAVATPKLLLLDEPTTALDQGRLDDLTRFLLRRRPDLAVILADATLHAPALVCDQVVVLDQGSIAFSGSRESFWQRLPEFQDLVTLGPWLDLWHRHSDLDAETFRSVLERTC